MRRLALRSALSDKLASGGILVVDQFTLDEPRTKRLLQVLSALAISGKVIIVLPTGDDLVRRASSNLRDVRVALPNGLSLLELLQADVVVFSQDALEPVSRLLVGEAA